MKLHLTTAEDQYLITGYDADFIEINKKRYQKNLVLLPDQLIEDWPVDDFEGITETSFAGILDLKPEVVLLGTGRQHHFLHPKQFQLLTNNSIALECMATAAACRTYNILMAEGRKVAAALII